MLYNHAVQLSKHTLKLAPESIQKLHEILEVAFHPLTICATIAPVFRQLSTDPAYAPYLPLLHRVLLSRLFNQLSQVYSSVHLSHSLPSVQMLQTASFAGGRQSGLLVVYRKLLCMS